MSDNSPELEPWENLPENYNNGIQLLFNADYYAKAPRDNIREEWIVRVGGEMPVIEYIVVDEDGE